MRRIFVKTCLFRDSAYVVLIYIYIIGFNNHRRLTLGYMDQVRFVRDHVTGVCLLRHFY